MPRSDAGVLSRAARLTWSDLGYYHGRSLMIWWYWIVLGVVLAAIELATPGGFYFIFFAVASLVVGLLDLLGPIDMAAIEWGLFSVISIISVAVFRKPLLARMIRGSRADAVDSLVGEVAVASAAMPAGQHGRAELRGTTWSARNVSAQALVPGERCRVVAVRGLELDIRPDHS